jgi:cytochrome c-type biogenesis protein CcmH
MRLILSSSFRRKPESISPLTVMGNSAARSKMDSGFRRNDGIWHFAQSISLAIAIAIGMTASMTAHAIDALPFRDRAQELRFQALTKQLRCLVCQNESLADSNAPLAADLRRDVFEQIEAGKSDEEIKAWLTSRYSDFVLYDPPLRAGTWLLWFGPVLVLVVGGFAVAMIVRRRSRAEALPPTASRLPADDGDDW